MNKLKIAILGDFPIGKVNSNFKKKKCFYAGWLYNLFELLKDVDEFDIHWIVANSDIHQEIEFKEGGQTFHLMPATRLTVGLYTAYAYNRYRIARCIKKINPHIFHGWGTERFYGLAAKDFKGKSILSVQGILTAYGQRAEISSFEKKQKYYEKCVLRGVGHITTESAWARDRVLEIAPSAKVTLWEYAPESRFFNISRNLTEYPSCLCAGTQTPVKDVPTAVKAFSSPSLSHVTLYIAGMERSREQLPPNIVPLGRLSREEMAEYLSKVWCLVHPSLADSSPNIVKEARVAGVPAVVTTECGGKQYIESGKSGFVINPRDLEGLIRAVLRMTESKEVSLEMGRYNQNVCRDLLSPNTMKNGIISLYRKVSQQ